MKIEPIELLPNDGKISCIYMIKNILNDKVYIGQTINYRKRSSDYRNATKRNLTHPIYKAIYDDGHENFEMSVIEACEPDKLTEREIFYIKKYESTNPDKGYNLLVDNGSNNTEKSRKLKSLSHIGLKESNMTKRKKSKAILAIKDRNLIIADSGKLFGDYIGKTKDEVKNALRNPSTIKGYRVYYDDYDERQVILNRVYSKSNIKDLEYIILLNELDEIEIEGVETIIHHFNVFKLSYDNKDKNDELFLTKIGRDYFEG